MKPSFYHFVLTFRGAKDAKGEFAEAAFHDHSFPKQEEDFQNISRYIEEKADHALSAIVFDELWQLYEDKYED